MNDDQRPAMFVHSQLDDSDLSASAFRVLGHLHRCAGKDKPAWPGIKEIATVCRINKDTVTTALRELEKGGWVKRVRRLGKTNHYFPKWPEGLSENRGYPKIGDNPSIGTGLSENRGGGLSENRGYDSNPRRISQKEVQGTVDRSAINSVSAVVPAEGSGREPCPTKKIVDAYNRICATMPQCKVPTKARARAMRNFWQLLLRDMENVEAYFEQAAASDFLSGRSGKFNGCNIDWLLKKPNAAKVLEGNYDNERNT